MSKSRPNTILRKSAFAAFALVIGLCLFATFGAAPKDDDAHAAFAGSWTCSMCPQFILPDPGKCPKCFMDLIPMEDGAGGGSRLDLYLKPAAAELAGITSDIVEAAETPAGDDEDARPLASVPATAVLTNLGRSFVFVESMDEESLVFTLREIETAGADGDRVLVASGVDEGEMVAATGVFRIDSAMQMLGKTSLTNLPAGELSADDEDLPPYQPAERAALDLRAELPGVDAWFERYEQIRAALAKDENAGADRPARELGGLLADLAPPRDGDAKDVVSRLAASSRELGAAPDLSSRRTAFESLTAGMVLLARRYGTPEGGLNLIFCPMAFGGSGAYWLQPGETVDNPYHGLEMPLCGWKVDAIEPFASRE